MAAFICILGGYLAMFFVIGMALYSELHLMPMLPEFKKWDIQVDALLLFIRNAFAFSMMALGFWFGQRKSCAFKVKG